MGKTGRVMPARVTAFTLVEVLVVIGIIAILASLLFPALIGSKERARRAVCRNNLRQFALVLHLYASDHNDFLAPGFSDLGEAAANRAAKYGVPAEAIDSHVPIFAHSTRSNLVRYASGNERIFVCPAFGAPLTDPGGHTIEIYGVVLGYNYLGGHAKTPWSFSPSPWISPQKITDDPSLLLLTDMNTFNDGYRISFVPHTATGSKIVGDSVGIKGNVPAPAHLTTNDFNPANFGATGGNLTSLDGSVRWKRMRDMTIHCGSAEPIFGAANCLW